MINISTWIHCSLSLLHQIFFHVLVFYLLEFILWYLWLFSDIFYFLVYLLVFSEAFPLYLLLLLLVHLLSCAWLLVTRYWMLGASALGWPRGMVSLSQSLLKLMSIELMMPPNHLILCCSLLLFWPSYGCIFVTRESSLWREKNSEEHGMLATYFWFWKHTLMFLYASS